MKMTATTSRPAKTKTVTTTSSLMALEGDIGPEVIEGHVPAKEIARLLREKPDALGLTVPGMPFGSPGMGPESEAEPYQVLLVKKDGSTAIYASYP